MGELLKFRTSVEGLIKKMLKYFCVFCKKNKIKFMTFFWLNFGLKGLFWAAHNVHEISIKRTEGHKLNY